VQPDGNTARLDISHIVEDSDCPDYPVLRPQRQRKNVHPLAGQTGERSAASAIPHCQHNRVRRRRKEAAQTRRNGYGFAVGVIDRHTGQPVMILETIDQGLKLAVGPARQKRFHRVLLAFRQQ